MKELTVCHGAALDRVFVDGVEYVPAAPEACAACGWCKGFARIDGEEKERCVNCKNVRWIAGRLPVAGAVPQPKYERFHDGGLKPFLPPERYDALRDDDRFLYNRGPKPPGLT